jgi:hypothetical protein
MIDPEDAVTLGLPVNVPHPIRVQFASADRIYTLMLTQDLFEDWHVMQSWGGKGNLRGGGQVSHVESFEAGLASLEAIKKTWEKRGCQPV